jgi:flavodoxin
MEYKIFIAYSSPSGSTRQVAESMNKTFSEKNVNPMVLDLAQANKRDDVLDAIKTAGDRACLLIGSPVYRDQAAPPVVNFLENLPESTGAYAVPFVTWGKACSGIALWQMGDMLQKKGFQIAGAAKVVAEHCLMWRTDNPPGKGHPDESDREMVERLVNTICKRLESKNVTALSIETLDYHPPPGRPTR